MENRIIKAKADCQDKILSAISEFEKETGLPVSDIEYHNDLLVKSFVTIVISL